LSEQRRLKRKLTGLMLSALVIAITASAPFRSLVQLPGVVRIAIGPEYVLHLELPGIRARSDQPGFLATEGWPLVIRPTAAGRPITARVGFSRPWGVVAAVAQW